MTIHDTKTSCIEHHEKNHLLTITFKKKIDSLETLQAELLILASHVHEKGIKNVLLDNTSLQTPVGVDFQRWAMLNIELPLLNAGVEKFAFVRPKDNKTFALIHTVDTARKRYFTSVDEAKTWLTS